MHSDAVCWALGACLWLAAAPAWAQAPAESRRTDGVVAAIGYDIVTRSLLEAYRGAFGPTRTEAEALRALVDERLLSAEARRYGLVVPAVAFREALAGHPAPAGIRGDEWRAVIADRVLSVQFLAFRFGDFVPVGRDDVTAYVASHPELRGLSPEAREAEARERLLPVLRARREEAFKEELRLRAEVRWMDPLPSRD